MAGFEFPTLMQENTVVTTIELVEGGNIIRQGHHLTIGYIAYDEVGEVVDLSGKDLTVSIWGRKGVAFEADAIFEDGVLRFTLDQALPSGDYNVEFTATLSTDAGYRKKYPTNTNTGRISVKQSADDLGVVGISVFTIDKFEKRQKELQDAYHLSVDSKVETLEADFEQAVGAITVDSEVVLARGEASTLRARLDAEKAATTQQLAEKAEKAEVENALSDIGISQLSKNKGLIDQTYLAPTLIQQIAGTAPVNAVVAFKGLTNDKIAERAVTGSKTDFLMRKSVNLLNKTKSTLDTAVNSLGQIVTLVGYSTSEYIPVEGGKTYTQSSGGNKACFDANKVFISYTTSASFTLPQNAAYLIITYKTALLNEMLVEGVVLPALFVEYDSRYVLNSKIYVDTKVETADIDEKSITPELTSFIYKDKSKINLLNPATITPDKAITGSGGLSDWAGVSTSDFIEVEPGKTYITSEAFNKAVFDNNKAPIISAYVSAQSVTIPANGKYIRVSFRSNKMNVSEMVLEGSTFHTMFRPYGESVPYEIDPTIKFLSDFQKKWIGKKSNHLGDSITQKNEASSTKKYYEFLPEYLPLSAVRDYGISSSTFTTGLGEHEPMTTRFSLMNDDADLATVFGGVNDFIRSQAPKGTFYTSGSIVNKDTSTFYGACHTLFEGLIKKYAARNTEILIITPLPRVGDRIPNVYSGMILKDYVDVIKEVANYYSLPVLDLYNTSGMNPNIQEIKVKHFADNTHPNNTGQERIASRLIGILQTL